jgi:nucleotide-binding universal stress UspA family protein
LIRAAHGSGLPEEVIVVTKPEYGSICCAIDFSEPSRFAMLEAAELARCLGAELELVHVHAPPSVLERDMLVAPEDAQASPSAEAEELMRMWRSEAERLTGRAVSSTVLPGDAASVVGALARERPFDLVIVGTHGRRGVRRFMLGSVAERIVREAPCTVVVVRHREAVRARKPANVAGQYA